MSSAALPPPTPEPGAYCAIWFRSGRWPAVVCTREMAKEAGVRIPSPMYQETAVPVLIMDVMELIWLEPSDLTAFDAAAAPSPADDEERHRAYMAVVGDAGVAGAAAWPGLEHWKSELRARQLGGGVGPDAASSADVAESRQRQVDDDVVITSVRRVAGASREEPLVVASDSESGSSGVAEHDETRAADMEPGAETGDDEEDPNPEAGTDSGEDAGEVFSEFPGEEGEEPGEDAGDNDEHRGEHEKEDSEQASGDESAEDKDGENSSGEGSWEGSPRRKKLRLNRSARPVQTSWKAPSAATADPNDPLVTIFIADITILVPRSALLARVDMAAKITTTPSGSLVVDDPVLRAAVRNHTAIGMIHEFLCTGEYEPVCLWADAQRTLPLRLNLVNSERENQQELKRAMLVLVWAKALGIWELAELACGKLIAVRPWPAKYTYQLIRIAFEVNEAANGMEWDTRFRSDAIDDIIDRYEILRAEDCAGMKMLLDEIEGLRGKVYQMMADKEEEKAQANAAEEWINEAPPDTRRRKPKK